VYLNFTETFGSVKTYLKCSVHKTQETVATMSRPVVI